MKNVAKFLGMVFFCVSSAAALVVGSNTAPSREGSATFPAIDSDNEMRGFALFESGFTLGDATTTCIFDAVYPVSGDAVLNGGTLNLQRDFSLHYPFTFDFAGVVEGNNHAFIFVDNMASGLGNSVGASEYIVFNDTFIQYDSNLLVGGNLKFSGECILDGKGQDFEITPTAEIVIDHGSSLLLRNVVLKGFGDNRLRCLDTLGTVSFQNVTWFLDSSYALTQGKFDIIGDTNITGTGVLGYESSEQFTVFSYAMVLFDKGVTFSYAPSSAQNNLLVLSDQTARIEMVNATLCVSSTGLQLTKGSFYVDGTVVVESDATVQSEGVFFGDGASASNDLNIEIMPDASVDVKSGYLTYNNVN